MDKEPKNGYNSNMRTKLPTPGINPDIDPASIPNNAESHNIFK